jgi:hypothetical protein
MSESCGCNKKKLVEKFKGDNKADNKEHFKGGNVEHFSFEAPKNMCHYACSSINVTNILLLILILVLLYLISREKFDFNIFKKN